MATFSSIDGIFLTNDMLATLISGYMPDGVTPVATTQRTNAGFVAPGQTAKQYVGKVATSTSTTTTVTLETVTAGKTFLITDIIMMSDSPSGATTTVDVHIQAGGVDIFRTGVHNLAPVDATGIETQPFGTSGQVITILLPSTSSIVNVWYNIFGVEQ